MSWGFAEGAIPAGRETAAQREKAGEGEIGILEVCAAANQRNVGSPRRDPGRSSLAMFTLRTSSSDSRCDGQPRDGCKLWSTDDHCNCMENWGCTRSICSAGPPPFHPVFPPVVLLAACTACVAVG
jgi:hypothetical protein